MVKIFKLIQTCSDCPHWRYYSGGTYECQGLNTRPLRPEQLKKEPPYWCPLPNYPEPKPQEVE